MISHVPNGRVGKMSKEQNDFRLGILFTREQTDKINQMAEFMDFFDLSDFVYYLIDKEYSNFIKKHGPIWSGDFE